MKDNEIIVLTKRELDGFKTELLSEIRSKTEVKARTEWLRSADVRELLKISDSTLQTMRINRTVPAYKLGTTWFYKHEEIVNALEKGKTEGGNNDV